MDFDAFNTAMENGTTDIVKLWMRWMILIFLLSLLFVARYKAARWAFLAIIATAICGGGVWALSQSVHLLGIAHLFVWAPLAAYIWISTLSPQARAKADSSTRINKSSLYHKVYMLWAVLIFLTIIISLVFDVRDIFLVATGAK